LRRRTAEQSAVPLQFIREGSNVIGLFGRSSVRVWCRRWIAAGLAAVLGGCAGPAANRPPAPPNAGIENYSYIIGPGDTLNILVARNPELSMSVPVRPDGKISAPLVDEMVAQGKTSVQLARELEKALGKYVRDPVVTIVVTNVVGSYSEQIRVVGEAARPQFLPYRQKMTLLDVMISVGGLTDFAAGNRAILLRTTEANKQYSVRLRDLLKGGDLSANVEMRPGDVLIIPQSAF
jgi:polysaccharide biosynthesis/export protein